MASNSLYPGYIKLHHETANGEHIYTLPVKPFLSLGVDWFVEYADTPAGVAWVTGLTAYITVAKAFVHTSHNFTYAELWTMDSPTALPIFRETAELNIAGTNATVTTQASQMVASYRTEAGGNGRIMLLDVSLNPNQKLRAPYAGITLALVNYLLSATDIIFGRDGSKPISVPKVLTKTNDVLRRKYNLT